MKKWGGDIILGLINGIINAIPGLRAALSAIGLNFPQSPPKAGPLSLITAEGFRDWGSSLIDGLSAGVNRAGSIMSGVSALAGGLSPSNMSLSPASLNAITPTGEGANKTFNEINITVDLTGLPSDTPKEKATEIGSRVGDAAAERLHQQLINSGYSAVNRSR